MAFDELTAPDRVRESAVAVTGNPTKISRISSARSCTDAYLRSGSLRSALRIMLLNITLKISNVGWRNVEFARFHLRFNIVIDSVFANGGLLAHR